MELAGTWRKVKPYMAMVFLQFGFAGMFLISVASLRQGMSHYVLVVYRNAVAAVVMAPFALWFERMERINIKERRSQAKIAGTAITVGGALLMILFKGPIVNFPWTKDVSHAVSDSGAHNGGHWLMGTFMILLSCFCWSAFFILQSYTLRSYPSELSLTTLICALGATESGAVALVMERDTKTWSIGFDMRLFTAIYSGIMCSGVAYYVQGIVIKERGPVFVTAFSPLCMIIVTLLGSIILSEVVTLGRLIGATVIVFGLYALIWGKNKDHVNGNDAENNFEKHRTFELPFSTTDVNKMSSLGNI
uniref:WAT1-related protein n=1 Tax=Setaria italica TaxID=4555 RepID=K4AD20_SETIT